MINNDSNLARILRTIHKKVQLRYDYFGVITGAEGVGKSRGLALNIIDYWYTKILKIKPPTWSISSNITDFIKSLSKAKPGELVILDEAGDVLDTSEFLNKLNKSLYQAYTVIRDLRIVSFVVLPSFFDLNPRFRGRRVKILINAYKRVNRICDKCSNEFVEDACTACGSKNFTPSYVAWECWNKMGIRNLLLKNKDKPVKSLNVRVKPIARGIVHEYKGRLTKYYDELKNKKTEDAIISLTKLVSNTRADGKHSCTYIYKLRKRHWQCKYCAKITKSDPYKR